MKDWTQTLALAGLILGIAVFLQTGISQIGTRLDRIDSRIGSDRTAGCTN